MTQDVQQFHAAMAESSHLASRALKELARAFELAASAHEAYRGHLAGKELRDTVLPEAAGKPAPERPFEHLPNYMQRSEPIQREEPMPWPQFFTGAGITPIRAVELIRAELPNALQPETDAERAAWPVVPASGEPHDLKAAIDNELQRAAVKLRQLEGDRAVAAQSMIQELMARQPRKGRQR